jgi:hypothetical protein
VFENRVLRRIFGPTDAGENCIMRNFMTRVVWARHVARMAEMRNSCKIWSENLKGSALRGLMRRWEDNIRMDLREVGWEVVDWIDLAQGWDQWRDLVYTVINLGVP